jgi:hypothetical protein
MLVDPEFDSDEQSQRVKRSPNHEQPQVTNFLARHYLV